MYNMLVTYFGPIVGLSNLLEVRPQAEPPKQFTNLFYQL